MKNEKHHKKTVSDMSAIEKISAFYHKNYKMLMIIPIIIFALAVMQIGYQFATTGDFMAKGVGLKGGMTITLPTSEGINIDNLESTLKTEFPQVDVNTRLLNAGGGESSVTIDADITEDKLRNDFADKVSEITSIEQEDMNIDIIGSSLGKSFFKQTFIAIIVAFIFMGIVVFAYFRSFIPSSAVILSAFMDIVITLAIVNLMGMKISTAGIAAFLMLIGYSIDTDILLTTRVLKEKRDNLITRINGAVKTGLTMSISTIAAVSVGIMLSQSEVLTQIMTIVLIGLVVDIVNTWILNTGILKIYMERKGSQ